MKNEKSAGVQVFFNIRLFVKQYNAKLTPDVLLRYGEKPWHTDLRWRSVAAIFCGNKYFVRKYHKEKCANASRFKPTL